MRDKNLIKFRHTFNASKIEIIPETAKFFSKFFAIKKYHFFGRFTSVQVKYVSVT